MANELREVRNTVDGRVPADLGQGAPHVMHTRVFVLRPRTALGQLALTAAVIGAGVMLFTVGIALVAALSAAALVTGAAVVAHRALAGRNRPPAAGLDPAKEVFLKSGD